jgi:hypothetical protein
MAFDVPTFGDSALRLTVARLRLVPQVSAATWQVDRTIRED